MRYFLFHLTNPIQIKDGYNISSVSVLNFQHLHTDNSYHSTSRFTQATPTTQHLCFTQATPTTQHLVLHRQLLPLNISFYTGNSYHSTSRFTQATPITQHLVLHRQLLPLNILFYKGNSYH